MSLGGSLGASGACRTCEDCSDSLEVSFRFTLGGNGGGKGGGMLWAFGTFTCGDIGIGPYSLLAPVMLRIIESPVVEELLSAVW